MKIWLQYAKLSGILGIVKRSKCCDSIEICNEGSVARSYLLIIFCAYPFVDKIVLVPQLYSRLWLLSCILIGLQVFMQNPQLVHGQLTRPSPGSSSHPLIIEKVWTWDYNNKLSLPGPNWKKAQYAKLSTQLDILIILS